VKKTTLLMMKTVIEEPHQILRQEAGRFDRRFGVGPARWPHFDLLWIHDGAVDLKLGKDKERVELRGPAGVLIAPDTPFSGAVIGEFANASVCHFATRTVAPGLLPSGYLRHGQADSVYLQNLIQVSLALARRGTVTERRSQLLTGILVFFLSAEKAIEGDSRFADAWAQAEDRIDMVRGLADVAAMAGMSESAFRALHRRSRRTTAGVHLREARLRRAEQLLSTTGRTIIEISLNVGYTHPESFIAAYRKARGRTPGAFRKWRNRFA